MLAKLLAQLWPRAGRLPDGAQYTSTVWDLASTRIFWNLKPGYIQRIFRVKMLNTIYAVAVAEGPEVDKGSVILRLRLSFGFPSSPRMRFSTLVDFRCCQTKLSGFPALIPDVSFSPLSQ